MNLPTKDMTALGEVQNYASKACFEVGHHSTTCFSGDMASETKVTSI